VEEKNVIPKKYTDDLTELINILEETLPGVVPDDVIWGPLERDGFGFCAFSQNHPRFRAYFSYKHPGMVWGGFEDDTFCIGVELLKQEKAVPLYREIALGYPWDI